MVFDGRAVEMELVERERFHRRSRRKGYDQAQRLCIFAGAGCRIRPLDQVGKNRRGGRIRRKQLYAVPLLRRSDRGYPRREKYHVSQRRRVPRQYRGGRDHPAQHANGNSRRRVLGVRKLEKGDLPRKVQHHRQLCVQFDHR